MGKKGRKTRWRRLPIGGTEEEGGISLEPADQKSTEEQRITFNEDEYTKITTPRQDVLFKKGYFGRKRVPNTADVQEVHSTDSVESETYVNEEPQYVYAAPTGYVDPTGAVYYVNSNSYETYDPYTGTVTVVIGPPPQYPPGNHPVLAAIPCQPVPLQPLEWFNPPAPWCYSYARRKRYSTDSQNCSAQSSESTGPPGSPQEQLLDEGAGAVFPPQQYVYPGYMFGAPMYNVNGVTVQGVIPQTQAPPVDLTANKRRKKRRRRRRGGVTDEGSESSCEEPLSCEATGSQSGASSDVNGSHSGASSDAGPGSSCSKANSDSGINTDPTPNSGTNSPPINICHDHIGGTHIDEIYPENSLPSPLTNANELINYPQFNSHVDVTLQDTTGTQAESIITENAQILIKQPEPQESCISTNIEILSKNEAIIEDVIVPVRVDSEVNLCSEQENLTAEADLSPEESISSCLNTSDTIKESSVKGDDEDEEIEPNSETLQELSCGSEITESPDYESFNVDSKQICSSTVSVNFDIDELEIITSKSEIHSDSNISEICNTNTPLLKEDQFVQDSTNTLESLRLQLEEEKLEEEEEVTGQNNINSIPRIEVCEECLNSEEDLNTTMERKRSSDSEEARLTPLIDPSRIDEVSMELSPEQPFSRFSSCRDVNVPIPPPRRKRSMSRAAEKTALKVVDNAVYEGVKEAACLRCKQQHMPITEAVTRWLNSQGSSALSCDDFEDNEEEEDEGIEEGEGSTDQKNVYGNPFLVSSVNDSRTRVADDCASFESSAGEWDMWDHTRAMCDPTQSVDKYYRLSVEEVGVGEKKPPSIIKTAVHIRHSGPFPCGVCCIIQ